MGDDEYHPLEQSGSNLTEAGGIGYMIVDVIDSLQIMGLEGEYSRARTWVSEKLSFERDDHFSTFEVCQETVYIHSVFSFLSCQTTIRVLGGLLSAYHLSGGDPIYLEKAIDLADRMLPAFETPSGLPFPLVNLGKGEGHRGKDSPGLSSIAEVATLQLEFRYLSHLTGDEKYWRIVEKVRGSLLKCPRNFVHLLK